MDPLKNAEIDFVAREYQVELLEKSTKSDSIVFLRTGAGKTFIAVMLIKEFLHEILPKYENGAGGGKRTIFLVPRVPLVAQQAKVIRDHVPANIGEYCGSNGVDDWCITEWQRELRANEILVMTPQILVNMFDSGFVPIHKVNLIIFDECHQATRDHPYSIIMRHISSKMAGSAIAKPRILGLSAAILNSKCKPGRLNKLMMDLEISLGAKIVTASNESSVNRFATNPKEIVVTCKDRAKPSELEEKIIKILERGTKEVEAATEQMKSEPENDLRFLSFLSRIAKNIVLSDYPLRDVDDEGFSSLTRMHVPPKMVFKNLLDVLKTLGLDCMRLLVMELILSIKTCDEENLVDAVKLDVKKIVQRYLMELQDVIMFKTFGPRNTTSKLDRLLEIVENLEWQSGEMGSKARSIVFVEQRIIAWALAKYLATWKENSANCQHLAVQFMVGNQLRQEVFKVKYADKRKVKQHLILERFRTGNVNLLVSTNVVEEGLDVPRCNVVVRFDKPKTFCSYVQSKGRARASDAIYFLLVEEAEQLQLCIDLGDYQKIEKMIAEKCVERPEPSNDSMVDYHMAQAKCPPFYVDGVENAVLTLESAPMTLNRYCSHLPSDRFTRLVPKWKVVANGTRTKFIMKFPLGCPIEDKVEGVEMMTSKLAKKAAAFEACKLLYISGELDKYLLPCVNYWEKYAEELGIHKEEECESGVKPGTRKRRQLYEVDVVQELENCYPCAGVPCYLHKVISYGEQIDGYKEHSYGFGILSCKRIHMPWPCLFHTPRGKVSIQLREPTKIVLAEEQISYLASCHRYLWEKVLEVVQSPMEFNVLSPVNVLIIALNEYNEIDMKFTVDVLHVVTSSSKFNEIAMKRENIVRPTYRVAGTFYIEKICYDMSPATTFPDNQHESYREFFQQCYNVGVKNMAQPLLQVNRISCAMNFVLCRDKIVKDTSPTKAIHHLPELCDIFPVSRQQMIALLVLPSFFWRMQWLLRVHKLMTILWQEANIKFATGPIPTCEQVDKVEMFHKAGEVGDGVLLQRYMAIESTDNIHWIFLKAITLQGANDMINMERLETLGDSFLKYATSVHLYCKFGRFNEGVLTSFRSKIVCNYNLYSWVKLKRLAGFVNAAGFDTNHWVPPGYCLNTNIVNFMVENDIPFYLWKHSSLLADVNLEGVGRDIVLQLLLDQHASAKKTKKNASCETYANFTGGPKVFDEYNMQLIGDKNLADAAEALLGACLVSGGQISALKFTRWLGLNLTDPQVDLERGIPWTPPKDSLIVDGVVSQEVIARVYASLGKFEALLGYTFKEKSFLRQALVHPSCLKNMVTNSYQQLEFLGDAVLDYLVTVHLYCTDKEYSPGEMTDIRSSIVDNTTLAYLSVKNDFHKYLEYMSPGLCKSITRYVEKVEYMTHPKDSRYLLVEDECAELEEIEVPKALGDVFESVAGAVFVDSGMCLETVWRVFYKMMTDVIVRYTAETPISPVRKLFEEDPSVKFSKAVKTEDDMKYKVIVTRDGIPYIGLGKTKYIAKNSAAKCALRRLARRK